MKEKIQWFEEKNTILNESLNYEKERKKADKRILALRNEIRNNNANIDKFNKKISEMEEDEEHSAVHRRYLNAIATLKKDNEEIKKLIVRIQTNLYKLNKKKSISETTLANISNTALIKEYPEPFLPNKKEDDDEEEDENIEILEKLDEKGKPFSTITSSIKKGKDKLFKTHERYLRNLNDLIKSREVSISEYEAEIDKLKEELANNAQTMNNEKKLQIGRRIAFLKKAILKAKDDIKDIKLKKDSYIRKNNLRKIY